MRKTAYLLLGVGGGLTLLLWIVWLSGFIFGAASLGGLIHLALVASMLTLLAAIAGLILLIVSLARGSNSK